MKRRGLALIVSVLVCMSFEIAGTERMKAAQTSGTITGQVMVRERSDREDSLLVGVDAHWGATFDEFRLELPQKWDFTLGYSMNGWTLGQDGKQLIARGESLGRINLRFDASFTGKDRLTSRLLNKTVDVEVYNQGNKLFDGKLPVTILDPVALRTSLDSDLQLPRSVAQGEEFYLSASRPFNTGTWQLGMGSHFKPLSLLEPAAAPFLSNTPTDTGTGGMTITPYTFRYDMPVGQGDRFTARYYDEWGELIIEAPVNQTLSSAPTDGSCRPSVTGGGPHAFAGQGACVAGCFPRETWGGLTLDGEVPLIPRAASRRTMILGIPEMVKPGPHTIQWGSAYAQGSGRFQFRVLGVDGSIDQNLLWRGQSTMMRLQVLGTEESLPLEIINRTPRVITVEGGDRQTVKSAGGASNALTRSVRGIRKGDFAIDYRLTDLSCGLGGTMRK